jgi:hypothetical protein
VQQAHAGGVGGTCQVPGAVGVDGGRLGRVRLGTVDVGPRGAVDDRVGPGALDRGAHGGLVGDIELGAREADQLVPGALARAQDVESEHPGGAGDEHPHGIEMAELSPTMKR